MEKMAKLLPTPSPSANLVLLPQTGTPSSLYGISVVEHTTKAALVPRQPALLCLGQHLHPLGRLAANGKVIRNHFNLSMLKQPGSLSRMKVPYKGVVPQSMHQRNATTATFFSSLRAAPFPADQTAASHPLQLQVTMKRSGSSKKLFQHLSKTTSIAMAGKQT